MSVFVPSFIADEQSLNAEDKIGVSRLLDYLVIRQIGDESTALFGELSIAFGIEEKLVVHYVETLQRLELLSCFRDRFNIGGDQTLYVGQFTREAYLKEVMRLRDRSDAAIEATPIYGYQSEVDDET
ncbi:hypothetical protein A6C57_28020 (plasmid) [Fibrella sp. ES10-3-2-2]